MTTYRLVIPIHVRYGDLDPQGHVNNATYLTYLEEVRMAYLEKLGLFAKGQSFLEIGIIMADAHLTFKAPIQFGQQVQLGMRISRLGVKSLHSEYRFEQAVDGQELALASSVLVAYDYTRSCSIPIPEEWRARIMAFEGLTA